MSSRDTLEKLLKLANAAFYLEQHAAAAAPPRPTGAFITISRQAGARGRTLANLLAERLNAKYRSEPPWTVWDRELVERVVAEHHISAAAVEAVERRPLRWWETLSATWSDRQHGAYLDEYQVYRRVAATIHALAQQGRAIIVGRGGIYATGDLDGGLHLRLVAPFEARVGHMAREHGMSVQPATEEVRRRDADRELFHKRYFPGKAMLPDIFTLTLNSGQLTDEQMLSCILPLI